MQRDAGPIGQHGQGLGKGEPFVLHHEAEHVAADVADPAAERLPLGIDLQAGARVVVPRAEGFVAAPFAPQLQIVADQIDDVDRLSDLLFGVGRRTEDTGNSRSADEGMSNKQKDLESRHASTGSEWPMPESAEPATAVSDGEAPGGL